MFHLKFFLKNNSHNNTLTEKDLVNDIIEKIFLANAVSKVSENFVQ